MTGRARAIAKAAFVLGWLVIGGLGGLVALTLGMRECGPGGTYVLLVVGVWLGSLAYGLHVVARGEDLVSLAPAALGLVAALVVYGAIAGLCNHLPLP